MFVGLPAAAPRGPRSPLPPSRCGTAGRGSRPVRGALTFRKDLQSPKKEKKRLNQRLSEQRAQIVQNYLQSKQVPHNFFAEGLGFSQPLPGANPASSLNQRTVIRLVRIGS